MKERSIRHPTDTTLELLGLGRLNERAVKRVEVHLLVCADCRARMTAEDRVRQMSRVGMEADPAGAAIRDLWKSKTGVKPVVGDFPRVVPKLLHFRTHLPVYSLTVAAGVFGEQQTDVSPEGWVGVPASHVFLTSDMFVTHITGRSMEPIIPNGSLCAFRSQVTGPWEGKTVLIEDYSKVGGNRYAVKRYHASGQRIILESINPAYRPIEIPAGRKINIIGEFAFTLGSKF